MFRPDTPKSCWTKGAPEKTTGMNNVNTKKQTTKRTQRLILNDLLVNTLPKIKPEKPERINSLGMFTGSVPLRQIPSVVIQSATRNRLALRESFEAGSRVTGFIPQI